MFSPKRFFVPAIALVCAATAPARVAAQVSGSVYGSTEWDTEESRSVFLGSSMSFGPGPLRPTFSIGSYKLWFPSGTGTQTITAVTPSAGLSYSYGPGGVGFSVGYSFRSSDSPVAPTDVGIPEASGTENTPVINGSWQYWGDGSATSSILGSYATKSQYLWSRARAARRVAQWPNDRELALGGEVVYQKGSKEPNTSWSFAAGPTLHYKWNRHFRTGIVVGGKSTSNPDTDVYPYFKLEFSFAP